MTKYLFIYRSSKDQHAKEMSPDVMQKIMEAWGAWIGKGLEAKWLLDPGDALNLEGRIVDHDKVVSDGPFAESKEIVGGYSIVEASDFDAACKIAKTCPAVDAPGGTIEVRELAGLA